MHTFRKMPQGEGKYIWTVGYYINRSDPRGFVSSSWNSIEDFTDEKAAAAYVNYLNGGNAVVDVCIIPV